MPNIKRRSSADEFTHHVKPRLAHLQEHKVFADSAPVSPRQSGTYINVHDDSEGQRSPETPETAELKHKLLQEWPTASTETAPESLVDDAPLDHDVPAIVTECVRILTQPANMSTRGLFRAAGDMVLVSKLHKRFKRERQYFELSQDTDALSVATLLRLWCARSSKAPVGAALLQSLQLCFASTTDPQADKIKCITIALNNSRVCSPA